MKRFITLLWIAVAVFMLSGCSNTKQEMELTYRDQGIKHMLSLIHISDPAMHGRIFSFMQITNACALPFGMLVFGPLADVTRIQNLLIFGGTAVLCCTLYTGKKIA